MKQGEGVFTRLYLILSFGLDPISISIPMSSNHKNPGLEGFEVRLHTPQTMEAGFLPKSIW